MKERTCVYCGCTDSQACSGGCSWVQKHRHTPTGVCSGCMSHLIPPLIRDLKSQQPPERRVQRPSNTHGYIHALKFLALYYK
jgi:hypothetical protein